MPTIDHAGWVFPCCALRVNHPGRAYANVTSDTLSRDIRAMQARPALKVPRRWGSKRLMGALMARGHVFRACNSGIRNQCGQMLGRVDLAEMDRAAEDVLSAERADAGAPDG
jgi:hypothetical protein